MSQSPQIGAAVLPTLSIHQQVGLAESQSPQIGAAVLPNEEELEVIIRARKRRNPLKSGLLSYPAMPSRP